MKAFFFESLKVGRCGEEKEEEKEEEEMGEERTGWTKFHDHNYEGNKSLVERITTFSLHDDIQRGFSQPR